MSSRRPVIGRGGSSGPLFLFSLFTASGLFSAASSGPATSFRDWIKSPEAYYATSEERQEWAKIGTEEVASRFIAMYWARRGETFRKEVQRRIEFAEKKFAVGSLPGSRSARGRVWMLLGAPNIERKEHTSGRAGDIGSAGPNIFERQSVVRTVWVYKSDRLLTGLGIPELNVQFQTDISRGWEVIENPAAVEPYLAKTAEFSVRRPREDVAASSLGPIAAVEEGLRAVVEPLWKSGDALAGARFFGDLYWNAKGEPFYAFQIYFPGSEKRFQGLSSVLFVGSVRDLSGSEVASFREKAALKENTSGGVADRYLDKAILLPNGRYTGVFALLSPDEGALLTGVRTDFELMPAPKELHFSQLHLTSHVIPLSSEPGPFDPFVVGAGKYVPKGDRRFVTGDHVGYFLLIRNPAGDPEPSMTLQMTMFRNGQRYGKTEPAAAELVRVGERFYLNANAFDAGSLRPGHYRLTLLFRDLKADPDSSARKTGLAASAEFDVHP